MVWFAGAGSAVLVILAVIGIVDVVRSRHKMDAWQMVLWIVGIVLVPIIGLVAYLFWRISRSEAMSDALSVPRDEQPPGHRSPIDPSRR